MANQSRLKHTSFAMPLLPMLCRSKVYLLTGLLSGSNKKNLEVTDYYSKKTPGMVAEEHASFVSRLAARIQVREAVLRSPQEIQKQAESALKRVGMLVPVCGGDCTLEISCPNQFDCIHCPAKAPDPAKRSQVQEKLRWARERLSYYEHEELVLETEKMKQLIRACELERKRDGTHCRLPTRRKTPDAHPAPTQNKRAPPSRRRLISGSKRPCMNR